MNLRLRWIWWSTISHLRSGLWNINTDTQRTIYRYHLVGQLTSRWFIILRLEVDAVVEMVEEDALCWWWADPESPLLAFLTSHLTSSQSSRPHEGHNWKSFRLTFNFEADLSNSEFSEGDETWGLRWNQPESSWGQAKRHDEISAWRHFSLFHLFTLDILQIFKCN